jgi:hypothetical protein
MAIPSWYQAQIPTTISAPTKIIKDIQHVIVSTIIGSTIQTNALHTSSLSSSTIQSNSLSITTLLGSTIQTNALITSTIEASTIQTNSLSFTTLFGSTIQTNALQYNTIIGCTIQTNIQDSKIIIGSSIQTNTLNVSSLIGSSIQTNTTIASSLINGVILTPVLYMRSSLGSTIHAPIVNTSTFASDSIQLNNLYVSTLVGSTIIGNSCQLNASNISSASGSTIHTNVLQANTLTGSTIQTDSFIVSTINITGTNVIPMNTLNVTATNSSTIICSTIQTNQMGYYGKIVQIAGEYITFDLGTGGNYHNQYRQLSNIYASILNIIQFVGSDDGITWTNLGISTPIIFETMHIFSYTLTNVRYIRLIFIGIMSAPSLEASQNVHLGLFTITYNGGTNLINYILVSGISSFYPTVTEIERFAYFNSFQFSIHSTYSVSIYPAIGYYTGSMYTDVFDINAIAGINLLTTSTIHANSLYFSTLIGSTIQANTLQVSTLLGSTFINNTIQSNILDASSLIGGIIQMNTISGNTITVSSIQTHQIGTSTLSGSTILMNLLDISTIIGSTIQTSQIGVSTIRNSTIQINTLTANMNIRSSNITTILGEYLTFDLGTGGNYHNKYRQEIDVGSNYPTKIYFSGSNDGILWVDLGLSEGTIINGSRDYSQPPYWDRIVFNYTTNNYRYLRIILINIWFYYGTYEVNFTDCNISNNDGTNIFPTTKANIIYSQNISTAPGDTLDRAYEFRIKLTTDAYYPWMYHTTGLYIGSVSTNVVENTPYSRTIANTIIGSTIQSDTLDGGMLQIGVMTGSTIIGSTIQTPQFNISTLIGSTIIVNSFQANKILITDGNNALSTSIDSSQLQYITDLVSQAGGIGQINTWSSIQTFSTGPIFNGLTTTSLTHTLGINASNQLIRYNATNPINAALTINYIPYASGVSTLANSNIFRINDTNIAIGQTTSAFPTGTGTTLSIAGNTQAASVHTGVGTITKIVMPDRRWGMNGLVIPDGNGCNFYMGTNNNNDSGGYSDTLYLNSIPSIDTSDSFNVRNNIVVTSAGTGFVTMPSFTPSSTALTFSALFICTGSTMPSTWARVFDIGNTTGGGASRGFLLAFHNSNVLWADYRQADGTITSMSTSIQLRLNTMYHVAWTISSSGSHVLYINGQQAATMTKVITFDTLPHFFLGRSNWVDPFPNMTMFDFRMMNRFLSANDILGLYYSVKKISGTTILSGQHIELNRPNGEYLNLAEIRVFSYEGGPNIITPSTSVSFPDAWSALPVSNFIDGNFNTMMHSNGTTNSTVAINLGSTRPIYKIVIYNRIDCCWCRANGIVLTIKNSDNTVIYTSSPIPDKFGRTTISSDTGNTTDFYYTFTYFPPYAAVIGDLERTESSLCKTNVVMFNKGSPGMRIYQGLNQASVNYTTYEDLVTTDANSGNLSLGSGSDTNGITFGPSATLPSILRFGSGTYREGARIAQCIVTDGNLHLDCASNGQGLWLNYYARNTPLTFILSYRPWTHHSNMFIAGGTNTVTNNYRLYWRPSLFPGQYTNSNPRYILASPTSPTSPIITTNTWLPDAYTLPAGTYDFSAYYTNDSNDWVTVTLIDNSTGAVIATIVNNTVAPWTGQRGPFVGHFNLQSQMNISMRISNNYYQYNSSLDMTLSRRPLNGLSATVNWGAVYSADWYYLNGSLGLYWTQYSRGIVSPEEAGNPYGNASTYGVPRGGWSGWGVGSKSCWMSNGTEFGIHDNTFSWSVYCSGGGDKMCRISSSCWMSQDTFRFTVCFNGFDTNGGAFYVSNGGTGWWTSDERIKTNIKPIDRKQSVAFINGIIPSYYCLKESKPCTQKGVDGKEETIYPTVCSCEQCGFIAQNVLESARNAGLPESTVAYTQDYERELLLPEEERKALLGISLMPIISHSVNALKELIAQVEEQQLQIDELHRQILLSEADMTNLQQIAQQQNELLHQLITT